VTTAADPRARDALGRPLDSGAAEEGHGVDVDATRSPVETLETAQLLLDSGFPFAAHEVLEARWKQCPEVERPLWQGLAQACVAATHAARGNEVGAHRITERARLTLADASPAVWEAIGIERAGIDLWIIHMLHTLESGGSARGDVPLLRLPSR